MVHKVSGCFGVLGVVIDDKGRIRLIVFTLLFNHRCELTVLYSDTLENISAVEFKC